MLLSTSCKRRDFAASLWLELTQTKLVESVIESGAKVAKVVV